MKSLPFVSRFDKIDLDEVQAAVDLCLPVKDMVDDWRKRHPWCGLKDAARGVKGCIYDLKCMGHPTATERWETVKELFND